jgi:hypothetical protein
MNKNEVLKDAIALIQSPEHWTQGALARDSTGRICQIRSAAATRFSLAGALDRVQEQGELMGSVVVARWVVAEVLAQRLGCHMPRDRDYFRIANTLMDTYNDIASHGDVIKLLDDAIEIQG